MNRCKGNCDNYPSLRVFDHKYIDGEIAYCKNCSKRFYRKDCNGYRCFCCKSLIRTNPRWRSKYKVRATVD